MKSILKDHVTEDWRNDAENSYALHHMKNYILKYIKLENLF